WGPPMGCPGLSNGEAYLPGPPTGPARRAEPTRRPRSGAAGGSASPSVSANDCPLEALPEAHTSDIPHQCPQLRELGQKVIDVLRTCPALRRDPLSFGGPNPIRLGALFVRHGRDDPLDPSQRRPAILAEEFNDIAGCQGVGRLRFGGVDVEELRSEIVDRQVLA